MTDNNNGNEWRKRKEEFIKRFTFKEWEDLEKKKLVDRMIGRDVEDVLRWVEKEIEKAKTEGALEVLEKLLEKTLCDFPKATTQKHHEYNIEIVKGAEKQAKEIIKEELKKLEK